MFIQEVKLSNVRSYGLQTINFSEGITILSGDIGSGKSTILMALEFALFGILRGKTSASELLKHGEKEGFVELKCEIQNKEIIIRRSLKRTSTSVAQKEGYLSINGEKESLTPIELKARILNLLGYPDSLINTSTNLFRYTVYTPQEQVKQILFESSDERKDIIRKIFDIDKYNRVSENINYYKTNLREIISRLQGQTDDVKTLQEQLAAQRREQEKIENKLPKTNEEWESANKNLEITRNKFLEVQKKQIIFSQQKNNIEQLKKTIFNEENTAKQISEDINKKKSLLKQNIRFDKQIIFDPKRKEVLKEHFRKLYEAKTKANKQLGEIEAEKKASNSLVEKISSIDTCPTCRQEVSSEHKKNIRSEQKIILEKISSRETKINDFLKQIKEKEDLLIRKREELEKEEKQSILYKKEEEMIERTNNEIKILEERLVKQKDKIATLKKELDDKLKQFSEDKSRELQSQFDILNKEKTILEKEERTKNNNLTSLKTSLEVAKRMSSQIEQSLKEKTIISKRINELSQIKLWIEELFTPLVKTIEKRVLSKVYHEFNDYFKNWFSILIDDDSFIVKLNDDFTPLIEQNGFDTSINNLSGGEKTALALAYRLALNKVLNNYFGSLHTKNLLILDEPTEGFSTEQIDRLREVVDQLKLKQLIIVSHEQKIESLADTIVRVEKSNQQSVLN